MKIMLSQALLALFLAPWPLMGALVPLNNPGFEDTPPPCVAPCEPAGWTMVPGRNFHQVDSSVQRSGLYSLKLDPCGIASETGGTDGGLYQDSASIAGAICTYTFCLWANGSGSSLDFSIEARNAANAKLAAYIYSVQSGAPITATAGWQRYCVNIGVASFPPATDHIRVYAFVNPDPACPAYYLDDLELESSSCLSPTPTMTPSRTATLSSTPHLSATSTPSPSSTPSITVTYTPSPTLTSPFTLTITPTFTETPRPLILSPINSPNPFGGGGTHIAYALSVDAEVVITVYTVSGEAARTLDPFPGRAGANETFYDGKNQAGLELASGTFVYRIHARSAAGETQDLWGKFAVLR
jgi:hypothetical protein